MKKPMTLYIFQALLQAGCLSLKLWKKHRSSSWKQLGHTSQYRHLPASSPSAFLNQHHSKFPAQQGFPSLSATGASTQPKMYSQKVSQVPRNEAGSQSSLQEPTPMFAFGTSVPAWKRHENPGHSPALSLEDESSLSILFLAGTRMGSLQGWKNLGSLRCSLHHVWAASVWLSKLSGGKISICGKQKPPPLLAKMCSCGSLSQTPSKQCIWRWNKNTFLI